MGQRMSVFRRIFAGFHGADSLEEYASYGYLLILPPITLVGMLMSYVVPPLRFVEVITDLLSTYLGIPESIFELFPAELVALVLLWWLGRSVGRIRIAVGRVVADSLIKGTDIAAASGERLEEAKSLSLLVAVALSAAGTVSWFQYSNMQTHLNEAELSATSRVSSISTVIATATHSVRDIPSFERIESQGLRQEFQHLAERDVDWLPVYCVDRFISDVFKPIDKTDDQLLDGAQWAQRLRGVVREKTSNICEAVQSAQQYEVGSLANESASLYWILIGRSYHRLAGEDCKSERAIFDAFKAFKMADNKIHHSSMQSGFGNVYGCVARKFAFDETEVEDLSQICESVEDCYNMAVHSHRISKAQYRQCSFQNLRANNNIADLTIKLAQRKWSYQGDSASLSFLSDSDLVDSLTSLAEHIRVCLGREATPAEVTVTLSQLYGTLALGLKEQPERSETMLAKSGWYLASSVLNASEDYQSWEMRYFCSSLDHINNRFHAVFQQNFENAGISIDDINQLHRRVDEVCRLNYLDRP